jgi:hypothetical protein
MQVEVDGKLQALKKCARVVSQRSKSLLSLMSRTTFEYNYPLTEHYGKWKHKCDHCGKKLNVLRVHGKERLCVDCWVKATDPDVYNALAELDREFPGIKID